MKQSLFDIQVNGFAGIDFQKIDLSFIELKQAVDALARHQTRRFFLTLITDHADALCAKLENIERLRAMDSGVAEALCGYHIEGPWLSPKPGFRGAHDPAYMGPPDLRLLDRLQKSAGGRIRLITLAPEHSGSDSFIREATARKIQISLGHTDASQKEIDLAYSAGARFCTHLGNGVPLELHRHDNVMQRLLAHDGLIAFFIPDGIHLPPSVLRNFFRAKALGKALFTTDCMAAAGAPAGRYQIRHHTVEVGEDRIVRMPGSQAFAGSALTPDQGVENLVRWLELSREKAEGLFSTEIAKFFEVELPFFEGSY